MALCSKAEYSEGGIRSKLQFWGAEPADIDLVIERLIAEKFIDDQRYATAYVRDKIRLNQWGRIKVRYMLSMEKIRHTIIDQALEEIDEEGYLETLKDLLQKKSRTLKGETFTLQNKQKLIKFAQSRGFEMDLILMQLKTLT